MEKDFFESPRMIAACKFGHSDKTYDYFCDFDAEIGQKANVDGRYGISKVTIMSLRPDDGKSRAEKSLLGYAIEKDDRTDEERAMRYDNGMPRFSRDGTMLDDQGNRSIFSDVDE